MGKGDRKSKKGKINKGTFGVRRPKKKSSFNAAAIAEKSTAKAKKASAKPKKAAKKTEKPKAKAEEKTE